MGNYERGVYEPSDEVRVFDSSEEEDVEGSRLPLLIVLALIVLFAFGGVVYFAYSQGVARGRGETPILTAAGGLEKVAPQNAGGAHTPYQGFKIYEQPAPPDDSADAATPPPAPAKPVVAEAAPAPMKAPAKPAAEAMAAKPVEKPAEKPVEKSVAAAPKATPKPATPAAPTIATGAPRPLASALPGAAAPAAPAATAPVAAATPAAGSYVLQIGAYKSQADADAAWKTYKAKHAALLSGFSQNVQQADLGEKGTWYRLRITGFSDKDVASATCDRLKADGGACFLGK